MVRVRVTGPRLTFAAFGLGLALALGCSKEPQKAPEKTPEKATPTRYAGALAVEAGGTADVALEVGKGGVAELTLRLGAVPNSVYFGESLELKGAGRADYVAPVKHMLYGARFTRPAAATGPCAGKPSSVRISLTRVDAADEVSGTVKAYCSPDAKGDEIDRLRVKGPLPALE